MCKRRLLGQRLHMSAVAMRSADTWPTQVTLTASTWSAITDLGQSSTNHHSFIKFIR